MEAKLPEGNLKESFLNVDGPFLLLTQDFWHAPSERFGLPLHLRVFAPALTFLELQPTP